MRFDGGDFDDDFANIVLDLVLGFISYSCVTALKYCKCFSMDKIFRLCNMFWLKLDIQFLCNLLWKEMFFKIFTVSFCVKAEKWYGPG